MAAPNFQNRTLFHSDNLPILQGMDSETVDLIATDPPFNKGRDFHATPDSLASGAKFTDRWSWDNDVHEEWTDAIKDDFPAVWSVIQFARDAYGDDMGAFMCFMGVRLMEMHRVLKPTGSLYLHCDPTASHYLKAMLDAIFGRNQFRNEIVWKRTSAHSNANRCGAIHDNILYYVKSGKAVWNSDVYQAYDAEYIENYFRYTDESGRKFQSGDLTAPSAVEHRRFEWLGRKPSSGRSWLHSREKLEELKAEGRVFITRNGFPRLKRFLDESKGLTLQDIWMDIQAVRSWHSERTGFRTQKPLALYERIIAASSNPGDLVLDPFTGCATTPIAAERLGRQWAGIDLWDGAYDCVRQRMEDNRQLASESNGEVTGDLNPQIIYTTTPPIRTDDGDSAPVLKLQLRVQRPVEPWQRLTHAQIRAILEKAQSLGGAGLGQVICAGCGISLPARHFELDHVNPRAQGGENWITNRVLLCGPCNRRKRHELTLVGLQMDNKRENDMQDESAAKDAWDRARIAASRARDGVG